MLVGLLPENSEQEEVIGITSTNPTLVQLLGQKIRIYTTKGKDLIIN